MACIKLYFIFQQISIFNGDFVVYVLIYLFFLFKKSFRFIFLIFSKLLFSNSYSVPNRFLKGIKFNYTARLMFRWGSCRDLIFPKIIYSQARNNKIKLLLHHVTFITVAMCKFFKLLVNTHD